MKYSRLAIAASLCLLTGAPGMAQSLVHENWALFVLSPTVTTSTQGFESGDACAAAAGAIAEGNTHVLNVVPLSKTRYACTNLADGTTHLLGKSE